MGRNVKFELLADKIVLCIKSNTEYKR